MLEHLRRGGQRPPELVYAAVVGHAVQPGSQRQIAVAGPKAGVGADEHLLEGVLGVLAARQHLPRVGEQPLVVAVVDRAERLVVAGPEQRHELLIRAQAQKRCPE